jgi:YggT family protein
MQLFKASTQSPLMRALIIITDPLLKLIRRIFGVQFGMNSELLAMLVAIIALWATRTVLDWIFEFVLFIPALFTSPAQNIGILLVFVLRIMFALFELALFVRIVFEWLRVSYASRIMRILWDITEPVLAPIRRAVPTLAGFDISPIIAVLILRFLRTVVFAMLSWIFLV